jgi:DNA-directed RNA polymerase
LEDLFKYFQQWTKILIKLNIPIKWETPLGYVVGMQYYQTVVNIFNMIVSQRKKQLKIVTRKIVNDASPIDIIKSKNSVSPNIIHSLDAN